MLRDVSRRRFLMGSAGAAVGAMTWTGTASAGAVPGLPATAKYPSDVLTEWIRVVYGQVKAERFSPTSAARAYAYVAIAGYEAVVGGMPQHRSLGGQLNDFAGVATKPGHDWAIALNEAMAIAAQAAFSDRSAASRAALAAHATSTAASLGAGVARPVVARSVAYGRQIGQAVADRSTRDNYQATRGLPYTPPVGPDKWERTPPNFGSALEPHWGQILSFTLASNDECKPVPPVPYSEDSGSPFWLQAKATYDTVNGLDAQQKKTALFWRDNPDGSTGLPSGHWMLAACIVIEQEKLNLADAAETLALLGISLADGFTSCWTEKYETNLVRPVTYIRRVIDPGWASFVNSPAFPEYTSGHSVGSGAAAETLTALLGAVPYVDDTGLVNGYQSVRYSSFWEAANEAAISRLYGGIHYPMAIEVGLTQGTAVAKKVLQRVNTRK